ncbi:alpha/beta hydrolase [Leuconostoc citreum]|uniref:RBBP9/YdeN family alpha/beta hydrolase n=1 Tax=Leuconostoc citreum TaxID=33964 RepID=UPI00200AAD25|nr:alpha/beta hydrolase [Leuconostoc citreum]MCK8605780.1 alpha/beta hydrolase [Leuconostoc citreum]
MEKIFLIDGYGGSPKENWLDWVGRNLENKFQINKIFIDKPDVAEVQKFDNALVSQITEVESSYFISHSLGCVTLLRYLINIKQVPKGIILVSPFDQHVPGFDIFDEFFVHASLEILNLESSKSIIISSMNDTIIPFKYSQEVAEKLRIPFTLLPTGAHFRASDGMFKFPEILTYIQSYWEN